jgi:PAP2 superfamily
VTTAASTFARTAGPFGSWLSVRHSLRAEAALVLVLYGLYELARGMVVGNAAEAVRHPRQLVALERSTGLFFEERMQDAAHAFPGLIDLLGISYLTFHLAVTVVVLLWLHRRRPAAFPLVRTTLVLASGLALVGYLVYPTAPPRQSGIGITDTVSGGHVDLNSGLVSSLYNPHAAVPSMHFGYALVVGAAVAWVTRRRLVQATAAFYPAFVLLVIVATGNHFLPDAFAGAVVVGVAASVAHLLARPAADAAGLARFPERKAPAQAPEPAGPGGRRRLCERGQRDRRPTPDEHGHSRGCRIAKTWDHPDDALLHCACGTDRATSRLSETWTSNPTRSLLANRC